MTDPYEMFSTKQTPQTEPLHGAVQVQNSAGGYVYEVDKWGYLHRFLILGSEGGSYYASEKELTVAGAKNLLACIDEDGPRVVDLIKEISVSGRAPRQNPAIFALAACAGAKDPKTRKAALAVLNDVCRIGTHLFLFVKYVEQFRGWGKGLRKAVSNWYLDKDTDKLAFQVTKYANRYGWTHGDVVSLAKPKGTTEQQNIFDYVCGNPQDELYPYLEVVEKAKRSSGNDLQQLVVDYQLPWEVLPTEALGDPNIWEAMLPNMGITALIRNLGRMSANGLLKPGSTAVKTVVESLEDDQKLILGRVHPIAVLMALSTYASGHGFKGSLTWTPVPKIIDALNDAFYLTFGTVNPANKRTMLALDISGSMGWGSIAGSNLTPREASGAMAMIAMRSEPEVFSFGFGHEFVPLGLSSNQRLDDVISKISGLQFGGTDCSLPMIYARENNIDVDTFIVYTDSDTWFGKQHPTEALRQYRDTMGIDAKLIVVGMVSNGYSIADPTDGGMLDVVGFDAAAPVVMNDFSAGR